MYWQARALKFAHIDYGLPAVCSYGMPRLYNMAIDVCQRRALLPRLNACRDSSVLDIGCGVGRWSLQLAQRQNRVTGIDISPRMVELATERAAALGLDCEFQVSDIVSLDLNRKFDLILAVTVFQHVVDDGELEAAVHNLASHLSPQGEVVLLEVAPEQPVDRCDSPTFRTRSLQRYSDLLQRAGLELVDVRGVDISPLRPVLLPAMRRMPAAMARWLVTAATLMSLPLDLLASRYLPQACWHQLLIARHRR